MRVVRIQGGSIAAESRPHREDSATKLEGLLPRPFPIRLKKAEKHARRPHGGHHLLRG